MPRRRAEPATKLDDGAWNDDDEQPPARLDWRDPVLSDLIVKVKSAGTSEEEYHLHRSIVAIGAGQGSSYFHKLVTTSVGRGGGVTQSPLELPSICIGKPFETALDVLYGSEPTFSADTVVPLMKIASFLMIKALYTSAVQWIEAKLSAANAIQVLTHAHDVSFEKVRDSALALAAAAFDKYTASKLSNLPLDLLTMLLHHPELAFKPEHISDVVARAAAVHEGSLDTPSFQNLVSRPKRQRVVSRKRKAGSGPPAMEAELIEVTAKDTITLLKRAIQYDCAMLKQRCMGVLATHFDEASKHGDVSGLPFDVLSSVLKKTALHVDTEDEVLDFVISVLSAQPSLSTSQVSELWGCIRFAWLTPQGLRKAAGVASVPREALLEGALTRSVIERDGPSSLQGLQTSAAGDLTPRTGVRASHKREIERKESEISAPVVKQVQRLQADLATERGKVQQLKSEFSSSQQQLGSTRQQLGWSNNKLARLRSLSFTYNEAVSDYVHCPYLGRYTSSYSSVTKTKTVSDIYRSNFYENL